MEYTHEDSRSQHPPHYRNLLVMAALSFAAMYVLMYAMVDQFGNVYANFNQAYMAALMAAPMVIIELVVMRRMYRNISANVAILAVSAIALVASFLFIRAQVGIGDKQFLRSMIPHHAGAILMCERASIRDREIQALCETIKTSQQAEIDLMRAMLHSLDR